jgi:hypothetical protein
VAGLRWNAWYHTIISWNIYRIVSIFMIVNVVTWLILAGMLYGISDDCGLKIHTFGDAVMLAIITMSTIGYGVQGDPYLQGCTSGIIVIGGSVMWGLILDAMILGIIMQVRQPRPPHRVATVIRVWVGG